jgi:hypothetical protein
MFTATHDTMQEPQTRRNARVAAPSSLPPALQKRARFEPLSVIQKFRPSLHAPNGIIDEPADEPAEVKLIWVRSEAFHSDRLPPSFVTRMRSPSNATDLGEFKPLPVRVAKTVPVSVPTARTTVTVSEIKLGTHMLVPSKAGNWGDLPTPTVCMTPPPELSFFRV